MISNLALVAMDKQLVQIKNDVMTAQLSLCLFTKSGKLFTVTVAKIMRRNETCFTNYTLRANCLDISQSIVTLLCAF